MSMEDFSDRNIRENCHFCNPEDRMYKRFLLEETPGLYILCDEHRLVEGHMLIIPKRHISCVAEYPADLYAEFLEQYGRVSKFIAESYGSLATFEHGVFGQTVYHSHMHLLPFQAAPEEIVPESGALERISGLGDLKPRFQRDGGYLFFSLGPEKWLVDPKLAAPRFFRDRFARGIGRPEWGNWKEMHQDAGLMAEANADADRLRDKWVVYNERI
jgi:histidine triad (HIT) family protein